MAGFSKILVQLKVVQYGGFQRLGRRLRPLNRRDEVGEVAVGYRDPLMTLEKGMGSTWLGLVSRMRLSTAPARHWVQGNALPRIQPAHGWSGLPGAGTLLVG